MPASRYMLGGAQFATALVTRKSVCKVWQQVWHFLRQLSVSCQRKTNSLVLRSPCHSCSIPFLGGVHSSLLREHERGHDTIPLHSIHSMRASREAQGAPAAKAAVSLKSTASKRAHRRCTTGRDATRWVRSTAARWTCGRRLWEVPLCLDPRSHEQLLLSGGAEPLKSVHKREHEQLVESKHGALLQTATVHATSPTSSNKMAHESHEPPVCSRRLWL